MAQPKFIATLVLLLAFGLPLSCAAQLAPDTERAIDAIVAKALAETGEPSVPIAVVKDSKLAYAQAYGLARIEPAVKATPQMRYKIGSNTKQFVAVAMLMLVDEGKLTLDDKVARFFPELTRAGDISVRRLLSHTAGYSDYYALDYLAPYMLRATTPAAMIEKWARQPLNFEPGARWEYSNTNYGIAGRIIEKLSGESLDQFIRTRITDKLGMRSAIDVDQTSWSSADPTGYERYALGPLRVAPVEGANWVFGAGQLAMTASDLALWDIALMKGTLLTPASRKAIGIATPLADGGSSGYSLGLFVDATEAGRTRWSHSGGMSGFVSNNNIYPDDGVAIAVLTNGAAGVGGRIEAQVAKLLLGPAPVVQPAGAKPAAAVVAPTAPADPAAAASLARVRAMFEQLQAGKPDRGLMDADLSAYFSDQVVADFAESLKPLGAVESIIQRSQEERGGMTYRGFRIKTAARELAVSTYFTLDGKLGQFLVYPR